MGQSFFCTPELCEAMFEISRSSILRRMREFGKSIFHSCVIDPGLSWREASDLLTRRGWSEILVLDETLTLEDGLDPTAFIEMARIKAMQTLEYRADIPHLLKNEPARIRSGDIGWYGGVYLDGITGGFSGMQDQDDYDVGLSYVIAPIADTVKRSADQFMVRDQRRTFMLESGGKFKYQ